MLCSCSLTPCAVLILNGSVLKQAGKYFCAISGFIKDLVAPESIKHLSENFSKGIKINGRDEVSLSSVNNSNVPRPVLLKNYSVPDLGSLVVYRNRAFQDQMSLVLYYALRTASGIY